MIVDGPFSDFLSSFAVDGGFTIGGFICPLQLYHWSPILSLL
ncbi:hypothetical protein V6Z12_D07G245300 [Gossypium hirsutum]